MFSYGGLGVLIYLISLSLAAGPPKATVPQAASQSPPAATSQPARSPEAQRARIDDVLVGRAGTWQKQKLEQLAAECENLSSKGSESERSAMLACLELCQWGQGRTEAARATMERRYELSRNYATPEELSKQAYSEAQAYGRRDYTDAAMAAYAQCARLAPNAADAALADKNIAVILKREKHFVEAEKHFVAVQTKYEKTAPDIARQCHYLAVDCARCYGDWTGAIEGFKDIASRYPGTPEAEDARHMVRDFERGDLPGSPRATQPESPMREDDSQKESAK